MTYDVQLDNSFRKDISYAELTNLPIHPATLIRRSNSGWMQACDCIELSHVLASRKNSQQEDDQIADRLWLTPPVQESTYNEDQIFQEERIFIPSDDLFKFRHKRKAAIIGLCTLGLAGLSLIGIRNTWHSNIFAGTSLSSNEGMSFILKCLSFCLLTAIVALPYFIYSLFALIYYSVRLYNLKR